MLSLYKGSDSMYFDYSASTPMSKAAKDAYIEVANFIFANPQSKHDLGRKSDIVISQLKDKIKSLLNAENHHITFTKNASEANRTIIEHIITMPKEMHVICGPYEHPSIIKVLAKLQKEGLKLDILETDADGMIDAASISRLITDNTTLVVVSHVDSELGFIQDLSAIKHVIKDIPLMSDITQSITKAELNMDFIDYASFSSHKFYGPKGLGAIIAKDDTLTEEGTLSPELIYASVIALEETLNLNSKNIIDMHQYLTDALVKFKNITINNPKNSIPHIVNISLLDTDIDDLVMYFSDRKIYLSRASACSLNKQSPSLLRLTKNKEISTSSIRISLSHLTTNKEIDTLIEEIGKIYNEND